MPKPAFRSLPVLQNGLRHSWDVFGRDDDRGTANNLTPAVVLEAAQSEIRTGERLNLSLPLNLPDPPYFSRAPYRHSIFDLAPNVQDDVIDNFYLQSSTQWDGLRHRKDPDFGFYGGVSAEDAGPHGDRLGVDAWAQEGVIGRGVLADIQAYCRRRELPYDPTGSDVITPEMVQGALADQNTVSHPGDILLVRTGYMGAYLASSPDRRTDMRNLATSSGLSPDEDMAEFLWDGGFAAVAVDNPGVEVLPRDPAKPYLHSRILPMLGMLMGEFFTFEDLLAAAEQDGRYSCFFCSVPLNLPRAVGSPANAVAIR
jgi:kynurenine formamidase